MEKVCEAHSGIISDIENIKKNNEDQWESIHRIENRLPVWATFAFSGMTFVLGSLVTYISVKF